MAKTLNLLLIEDSEYDAKLLLREFQRSGYVPISHRVETEEALLEALERQEWDVILGDYAMPHLDGIEALTLIRERGIDVPFIFVSGTVGEEVAVQAMRAGAQDYIMKGSLKRLVPAVERELRETQVRRDRIRTEGERRGEQGSRVLQNVPHAANSTGQASSVLPTVSEERMEGPEPPEPLPRLSSLMWFKDRLKQAMYDANRRGRWVGVALLDLDFLQTGSDGPRSGAGDPLLMAVSERFTRCVRGGDTVARLSGDGFSLILSGIEDADDAARVIQRLLDHFAQPFYIAGREFIAGVTVGVTLYPLDENSAEGLLRNAGIAMRRAKERGRNVCEFFSLDVSAHVHQRLALENALFHALEQKEFLLHYQFLVDIRSEQIKGVEALIRWRRPGRGLVLPAEFIPVAEKTGRIVQLGEWVLQAACEQFGVYYGICSFLRLAVNVSAAQFKKDFPEMIVSATQQAGLDPALLDLEVSEDLLMQDLGETLPVMNTLSGLGVRFSIDAFGTGHSGLNDLKRFPISSVKIDQTFVRGAPTNPNDAAIVKAIVSMARSLGLGVIAEGVETEEQISFLSGSGCDMMQGYYLGRPLPPEDVVSFLKKEGPLSTGH